MVARVITQTRLFSTSMVSVEDTSIEQANRLLVTWEHKLGPLNRPFRNDAFVLKLGRRPIAVATSSSIIGPEVVGFRNLAERKDAVRWQRHEVIELSRLATAPDAAWASRVMLRLWREVFAPSWPCWKVFAAISYSHNALHSGDLYRFDGWKRMHDRAGSTSGYGWSNYRPPGNVLTSKKSLWVWEYH